jgi:hypothetical protein
MYVRGYLQGSENGRVVTIAITEVFSECRTNCVDIGGIVDRHCLSFLFHIVLRFNGLHDTTVCDKVCQWLAVDLWFSPGTPPLKLIATIWTKIKLFFFYLEKRSKVNTTIRWHFTVKCIFTFTFKYLIIINDVYFTVQWSAARLLKNGSFH